MIRFDRDYNHINRSFRKKVVFRVGLDAGFFSEYNNMILAMAWCLKNNYQFQLFSRNANFGYDKGWMDYFIPFCTEVNNEFHLHYNHRPYPYGSLKYNPLIVRLMKKNNLWGTKFDYYPLHYLLLKKLGIGKLLTQDIFDLARKQNLTEDIEIPELGFKDSLRSLCKFLTDITWKFNQEIQKRIDELIKGLNLSEKYIGFHIRGGDKYVEYQQIPIGSYINKAETLSDIRKAFVLTDDYRIIRELSASYPNWNFYTLCQPHERGYYHTEFMRLNIQEKKNSHIRLFSSMMILELSGHFIGTFSSNPGMFMGMRMSPEKCHGVDFDEWHIW